MRECKLRVWLNRWSSFFNMLPWQHRLYFWSVHGIFAEVLFTSLWEFIITGGGLTLRGCSSLWSFIIYGLGTFLIAEQVYFYSIKHRIPLFFRLIGYVLMTYLWEFTWGIALKYIGANSWDYSQFTYNIYGVITLEYAPFWVIASLVFEYIMHQMEKVEPLPIWKTTSSSRKRTWEDNKLLFNYPYTGSNLEQ